MLFTRFVALLERREDMQRNAAENIRPDDAVIFGYEHTDGGRRYILTRVSGSGDVDSFSGEAFEKLQAKSGRLQSQGGRYTKVMTSE